MSNDQEVTIASGDALDVREFSIAQLMSKLFSVTATAIAKNLDVKFDSVIGREASFTLRGRNMGGAARTWRGVLRELDPAGIDEKGRTTYHVRIDELCLAAMK
ncbi:MAG: hypothetical protein HOW73_08170 [Polyangiaceae bacterium]|nr:hypothetical protein [Polyangiaceae bacterium]